MAKQQTKQLPINKSTPVKGNDENKVGGWTAMWFSFRDIGIASLAKGQFPIFIIVCLMMLIVWKLPENELSNVLYNVLDRIERNTLWGWCMFVIVSFLWYFQNRYSKKTHKKEVDRLTKEKEIYQEKLFKIATNKK